MRQASFKLILVGGGVLGLLLAGLFGNAALSYSAPSWLQMIAREIQAACRDAGTQWMVVVCLVSYFVTFLVLERRVGPQKGTEGAKENSSRTQPVDDGSQKSEEKAANATPHAGPWDTLTPSPSPNPIGRGWRRAVRGGAGGLFARLVHLCGQNPDVWLGAFVVLVLLRYAFDYTNAAKSLQVVVLLTGIVIGKGVALWVNWGNKKGETPTSNAQHPISKESSAPSTIHAQQSTNHRPTAINKAQAVLSLLVLLLALSVLWHPERGMEFFYRGQQRWTGPWDNPNLFGLLMGVGLTLAVGQLVAGYKLLVAGFRSPRSRGWRISRLKCFLPLVWIIAVGLCALGLLMSYSRGAWLGTAVALGFLVWKWVKRPRLTTAPRPTDGEGESLPRFTLFRRNVFPTSILLFSLLVISFWQFRHTELPLARRVFSVGNVNDFSWRNRVAAWEGAARMMGDKPLLGFGWGKAETVYSQEYRAARLEESAAIQMNDYLMIGISAGVPALLGLVLYLVCSFGCGRREMRNLTGSPPPVEAERVTEPSLINFQLATSAATGATVLLVGFWFDGGLFKLPTCVVFWVLLELARTGKTGEGEGRVKNEEEKGRARHSAHADAKNETNARHLTPAEAERETGAPGVTRPTSHAQPSTIHFLPYSLRWLTGIAALLAIGLTTLHLGTPQLAVSERTLGVARRVLVPAQERSDFDFLASKNIWSGQPLKTLIQHAHLANYTRTLVNWKVPDELYHDYVLSPETVPVDNAGSANPSTTINHTPSADFDWRRFLWEYFYPRIRKESSIETAVEIVLRRLQAQVAVNAEMEAAATLRQCWERKRATEREFALLSVAALRSVGIPARLSGGGAVEYWNGSEWRKVARALTGSR